MAIIPPVVLLKPEGSRDTNGAITPALTNIAVTSGQYGQAWEWDGSGNSGEIALSSSVTVPMPAGGTVIYRYFRQSGGDPDALVFSELGDWGNTITLSSPFFPDGSFGTALVDKNQHSSLAVLAGDLDTHTWAGTSWTGGEDAVLLTPNGSETFSAAHIDPEGDWGERYQPAYDMLDLLLESIAYYDAALTPEQITAIATMPTSWTWENLHIAPPPPPPRFGGLAWSVPLHGDIAMHVEAPDTGIAVHRDIPTDTIAALHEPGPDGIRVIQKVEDLS